MDAVDQNRWLSLLALGMLFALVLPLAMYADSLNARQTTEPAVVLPPFEDIEELWAIEDARTESAAPLVTCLENNGSPLGYDAQRNTFYCTLGLEAESDWPEIVLTAPEASGVTIRFLDDYTYDWRDEAVAEGYPYELIAYTDTEYAYFDLVFTGLPIVSIFSGQEIGTEYVPAAASVSSAEHEAVRALIKAHTRGSAFHADDQKVSYRLEFHRINQQGKDKKNAVSLLGMQADTDWLLISNADEDTQLRNYLAWDMWRQWNPDGDAFSLLESRMVEVFVNNEYRGLYQLMQRVDTDAQIVRMGGNPGTDCAFRILSPANVKERLVKSFKDTADVHFEVRKPPLRFTEESSFAILDDYIALADVKQGLLEDDAFLRELAIHMDVEDLLSYYLFSQAISLQEDNVYNNLYVWAIADGGGYRYWYAPWDMDRSFVLCHAQFDQPLLEGEDRICTDLRIPYRLLELDGLDSRRMLWSLWIEKRNTILSDDALYQWFHDAEDLVNLSGAFRRNSERWYGAPEDLDISDLYNYTLKHLGTLDQFLRECWPYGEYTPEGKPTITIR